MYSYSPYTYIPTHLHAYPPRSPQPHSIVNGSLYGGDYDINKCSLVGKPLSKKCFDFFVQEQCAYECDPNFGMWGGLYVQVVIVVG